MPGVKQKQGFTLIELMITIAVLAILMMLATPVLNMTEQRRVIGAAESALSQIQAVRSEAIQQRRDMYFRSEVNGDQWCHGISEEPGCSCMEGASNACEITIAGGEDPVERATRSDQFSQVSMTGDQELRFSHIRGTVSRVGAPGNQALAEPLVFTSASGNASMQVDINLIGRPRACGIERGLGAYNQC
ncbi:MULTISPECIES: Tfp pilus assembly protein FimT/FimU [unclassified Thioalkalivibrio]|uniref:pilus assembly FimT family protein n=1 Tax=unclassified Thioalkalivibrio TaxID=2621013 RepID=UPI0004758D3B|nr:MULTISPECIES: GspH/FimT family pseudopilin [unclassified Thioalkalivibrio]